MASPKKAATKKAATKKATKIQAASTKAQAAAAQRADETAQALHSLVALASRKNASGVKSDGIAADIDTLLSAGLPPAVELLVLAHLKGGEVAHDLLMPLAAKLANEFVQIEGPASEPAAPAQAKAFLQVLGTDLSRDPLHRSPHGFVRRLNNPQVEASPDGAGQMQRGLHDTMLTVRPMCTASQHDDFGSPALYLETTCYSKHPLDAFVPLIDPTMWPDCPLMHFTFRGMDPIEGHPRTTLPSPDQGWEQTLRETVRLPTGPSGNIETNLNFRYVQDTDFVGSTFSMAPSDTDVFTRDQGFLLAQDLTKSPEFHARKFTTMKAVWFKDDSFNDPGYSVCGPWSISLALLMHACLGDNHQEANNG